MSLPQTAIEELAGRPLTTLSEDEQMFRASVREFAETEIAPSVMKWDEAGEFPMSIIKELHLSPTQYGLVSGSFFLLYALSSVSVTAFRQKYMP